MKELDELAVAIKAAEDAGRLLMEKYGQVEARYKPDRSIVTSADLDSEKLIRKRLQDAFPNYSIVSEEKGTEKRPSKYTWAIDPLDGTTNYTIRNPFFGVSIALMQGDNPIVGAVHYPFQKETFHARKGEGAFLNGEPVHVSERTKLEYSVICFCHSRDRDSTQQMIDLYGKLKPVTNKVRQIGAASLEMCYVACGRADVFVMLGINLWDVAAGAIIVEEAGGVTSDFRNKPFARNSRSLLATNGRLHQEMLSIIGKQD